MIMYCDICGAKIENGDNITECPECLCDITNFRSPFPDGDCIRYISTDESFANAIYELYKTNPIEYQLKIQEFKTQIKQQKQIEEQNKQESQPHCPTCNSTNVVKIKAGERVGSVVMLGLFSKKINKSYKCRQCGHTW